MEDCLMQSAFMKRLQYQQSKCGKNVMKGQLMLMGRERRREADRENIFAAKKLCFDEEDESRSNVIFTTPSPIADRYIPLRTSGDIRTRFGLMSDTSTPTSSKTKKPKTSPTTHHQQNHNSHHHHHHGNSSGAGGVENSGSSEAASIYSSLLHNELVSHVSDENSRPGLFKYSTNLKSPAKTSSPMIDSVHPYSLSPVSTQSQLLLRSPRKPTRRISRIPFKVLDAPELQDDFYLNLVDWSSSNVLSVGLASCVYLWSAATSQVTRLCDLSTAESNSVTSVSWNERGNLVAVGTNHGYVEIWDAGALKQVAKLQGHSARVGTLAWNGDVLSSGSRDRLILQRDIRVSPLEFERRLSAHRQEVCGLKWSPDNQYLASGGNDNKLHVWNMQSSQPVATYDEHIAAVKAIAWSPHHHGLLASGGGTADRTIRFWNTLTGQAIQSVDTGSQVCNLAWSKHSSELVSTHGYSQNQILVWKYPSLAQVSKLTGHTYRVLYLAMSPCGESIVTGAGDETLRFWNVFSKATLHRSPKSQLSLFQNIR